MENNERNILKKKCNNDVLPTHLILDKIERHDSKPIAGKFNNIFVNVRPTPAAKIPQSNLSFKSYPPKLNATLHDAQLTEDEFEKTVKPAKRSTGPGRDRLIVNVITSVYELIKIHCSYYDSLDFSRRFENSK